MSAWVLGCPLDFPMSAWVLGPGRARRRRPYDRHNPYRPPSPYRPYRPPKPPRRYRPPSPYRLRRWYSPHNPYRLWSENTTPTGCGPVTLPAPLVGVGSGNRPPPRSRGARAGPAVAQRGEHAGREAVRAPGRAGGWGRGFRPAPGTRAGLGAVLPCRIPSRQPLGRGRGGTGADGWGSVGPAVPRESPRQPLGQPGAGVCQRADAGTLTRGRGRTLWVVTGTATTSRAG